MKSETKNIDCMLAMKDTPDKFYELAIVDPPYGSGGWGDWEVKKRSRFGAIFDKYKINRTGGTWSTKYQQESKVNRSGGNTFRKYDNRIDHWDVAPDDEYFTELFRISKEQIIWGGNYFGLPPNRCFLIWKKLTISESFSMAMAEYAWCSFQSNAKIFECAPQNSERFHPTQKPVSLYKWLLKNYAKPGDKILDTHLGSGSSRIACYDMGFDFTGYELDKEYFDKQEERFANHISQSRMFQEDEIKENLEQKELFNE